VDLPGLGDTFGAIPMELLTFITQGGYANIAIEKIKELIDRFSLAGIVIVGHCAGGVTALFAASELKVCKGLILMDPYFDFAKRVAAHAPEIVSWSRRSRLGKFFGTPTVSLESCRGRFEETDFRRAQILLYSNTGDM
jgi:pimeloyl-ACP methyl ester carboxylesterase